METGNNREVQLILREYKQPNGAPNYLALYNIPNDSRIRDMAKKDFTRVNMLIIGALTVCFEGMNLKRGMNEIQILTLSETIIDSSEEDNLSFEDFMLFLQNMLSGKYEMSYESIDVPKFMRMFEVYRQERWSTWVEFNENQHLHYKALGDGNRTVKSDPLAEHFSNLGQSLHELRTSLAEQRKEMNTLKQAKDFYDKL